MLKRAAEVSAIIQGVAALVFLYTVFFPTHIQQTKGASGAILTNPWSPSTWAALVLCVSVVSASVLTFLALRRQPQTDGASDNDEKQRPTLLIIGFDYVSTRKPNDPDGEWETAEAGEVTFSRPQDAIGDGYLQMAVPKRFAMDRVVREPHAQLSKGLRFSVKLPDKAAVYAGVWLKDRNGKPVFSTKDNGMYWIVYRLGDDKLSPYEDERVDNEIVVWMRGRVTGNGWTFCSRDLEKDTRRAYPQYFYSSLGRIRLRGRENTLSISPIRLLGV
jgi:hypothetical protein